MADEASLLRGRLPNSGYEVSAVWLEPTVYPFLGYLRAKSRLVAVALRNAPAGAVPRTPLHPQGVCGIRKAAEPLTAALPYRRGEFTTLSTASPLIVSKESFWSAVVHKKRPAALWLLAVIHILSPSFWRGAGSFGKGPSPPCCLPCVTRCRPDNPRQTAPSARFPWEAGTR